MRFVLLCVLVLLIIVPGYAQDDDPADLPLLPEARHVGTMFYGGNAPPLDHYQPRIDEATASGMNAFSLYLDWPVLEPSEGTYDFIELQESLTWAQAHGLSTFANITLIDIEELVMPPEFLADGGALQFADGIGFTDPDFTARFLSLLDDLVPLLVDSGVFYLGVGNEVDGWLNENPDQLDAYLIFVETVRDHVRGIAPDLAVGITVTGNVPLYDPAYLENFYPVTDVVSANIYGIDINDFTVTNRAETIELLEQFIAAFEGRPIVIPELGCNSAESMESNLTLQRDCFETMFDVLADHPNVRFVTVFTFHDFEDETCQIIQEFFGYESAEDFETIFDQRVADYLCTLGIVNADGTPKPAFDAFLAGIAELVPAEAMP